MAGNAPVALPAAGGGGLPAPNHPARPHPRSRGRGRFSNAERDSYYCRTLNKEISESARRRLSSQFPDRINWHHGPARARITAWHWRPCLRDPTQAFLRTVQQRHAPGPLLSPVHTQQVIYVLYTPRLPGRFYVGQTKWSAWHRFKSHVRDARTFFRHGSGASGGNAEPLHREMARNGWSDIRIFPIEQIQGTFTTNGAFRATAMVRETFWKRTLHAFMPHGWSFEGKSPARAVQRRSRRNRSLAGSGRSTVLGNVAPPPTAAQPRLPPRSGDAQSRLDNRVALLFQRLQAGTLTDTHLESPEYNHATLDEIHDRLRETQPSRWNVSRATHSDLLSRVEDELPIAPHIGVPAPDVVVLLFQHTRIESLGLNSIVSDPALWASHGHRRIKSPPLLTYKFADPISRRLCNYSRTAQLTTAQMQNITNAPCVCGLPSFARYVDSHCGHVLTTDATILRSTALENMWKRGAYFRAHPFDWDDPDAGSVEGVERDLSRALTAWVESTAEVHRVQTWKLWRWAGIVKARVYAHLQTLPQLPAERSSFALSQADEQRLVWLQRNFVITTVDKAAQNLVLVCKSHYLKVALQELQNGPAYQPSAQPSQAIRQSGEQFCRAHHIKPLQGPMGSSVPNFHLRAKLHKAVPSFRFVAGSQRAPLTPVSKWLVHAFNALLPDVHQYWADLAHRIPGCGEVQHCWIVQNSRAVREHLARMNSSRRTRTADEHAFATFDFTTMYTSLNLADLELRMGFLIDRLFIRRASTVRRHRFLLLRKKGQATWLTSRPLHGVDNDRELIVDAPELKALLSQLIHNSYVEFAGTLYHQHLGIPMGTPCAGQLANLYLFTFEYEWLRRIKRRGEWSLARAALNSRRYIDDLFVIGNPGFESRMYRPSSSDPGTPPGLYPRDTLTLLKSAEGSSIPFLDLQIKQNARRGIITSVFDKRLEKAYTHIQVIRCPDVDSFLANKVKANIVTAQMHRFMGICSRSRDFAFQTALCLHRLSSKGYPDPWLWPRVNSFLLKHPAAYSGLVAKPAHRWMQQIRSLFLDLANSRITPGPHGPVRGS